MPTDDREQGVRKSAQALRDFVHRAEMEGRPYARSPLLQQAKEIANLADIWMDEEKRKKRK